MPVPVVINEHGYGLSAGCLAYVDSFAGLLPCRVTATYPETDRVSVVLTANRGSYRKGERMTENLRDIIAREQVYTRSGQYRITGRTFIVEPPAKPVELLPLFIGGPVAGWSPVLPFPGETVKPYHLAPGDLVAANTIGLASDDPRRGGMLLVESVGPVPIASKPTPVRFKGDTSARLLTGYLWAVIDTGERITYGDPAPGAPRPHRDAKPSYS